VLNAESATPASPPSLSAAAVQIMCVTGLGGEIIAGFRKQTVRQYIEVREASESDDDSDNDSDDSDDSSGDDSGGMVRNCGGNGGIGVPWRLCDVVDGPVDGAGMGQGWGRDGGMAHQPRSALSFLLSLSTPLVLSTCVPCRNAPRRPVTSLTQHPVVIDAEHPSTRNTGSRAKQLYSNVGHKRLVYYTSSGDLDLGLGLPHHGPSTWCSPRGWIAVGPLPNAARLMHLPS
jgi:hypothetical protein